MVSDDCPPLSPPLAVDPDHKGCTQWLAGSHDEDGVLRDRKIEVTPQPLIDSGIEAARPQKFKARAKSSEMQGIYLRSGLE